MKACRTKPFGSSCSSNVSVNESGRTCKAGISPVAGRVARRLEHKRSERFLQIIVQFQVWADIPSGKSLIVTNRAVAVI
jgi:hypothetical protein